MKICVAQTKPLKGDIESNIECHKKMVRLAAANGATIIIFPELSLTGYEPALAASLASTVSDSRFDDLKKISDGENITIGVGMPVKESAGIKIGMIIFQPHQHPHSYSKQHLHPDEYPYFVKGTQQGLLADNTLALAICYELSVPEHIALAYKNGARMYVASVAKSVHGVEKALGQLVIIAKKYSIPVLMSNCIGHCDDFDCGGKTSALNNKGELAGQLNDTNEGILIMDTETQEIKAIMI
jgi:predicted amidohydrolase